MAIDPAMVEKDWHVTQVLAFMANLNLEGFKIVFSGGTSLSKAHGLIKRFSEDIDFKVITVEDFPNKKTLSNFKNAVVDALEKAGFPIDRESLMARDENKFFSIDLNYNSQFAPAAGLRPHVQIEISVNQPKLPTIERSVQSLFSTIAGSPSEVDAIDCIDPVETAADKLSALVWRIPKQVSDGLPRDRSLVRHIHDLAALEMTVEKNPNFPKLVIESCAQDNVRNKEISEFSNEEKFKLLIGTISNEENNCREEYNAFVLSVSYAEESAVPEFDTALEALKRLISLVLGSIAAN